MLRSLAAALILCAATIFAAGDHPAGAAVSAPRGYSVVISGRPAGCPRAYCGCASARYVGLRGRQWWLAARWLTLPRASPAPGMAAARRGHVKIITAVLGNGRYRFYDPNSGGGLTRITTGTLAGYTVVNPRGYRAYAGAW